MHTVRFSACGEFAAGYFLKLSKNELILFKCLQILVYVIFNGLYTNCLTFKSKFDDLKAMSDAM